MPYEIQKKKIQNGVNILREHGVDPRVFFAPSHTFDEETIRALKECTNITVISDTVANKPYKKYGITFIPQQSGHVRHLPFNTVTFCYHPNTMKESSFAELETFLKKYKDVFKPYEAIETEREVDLFDRLLRKIYFIRRK